MAKGRNALHRDLLARMEQCPDFDSLNDEVILPFVTALEKVCADRGYLLNIYGTASNLAVTDEISAPALYEMIEEYLDSSDAPPQDEGA
ncbi:hypothetical protein [Caenispirillum bisanense]|uniref:Uncharacterized protein n=1 Tax=Caenispirillum bisanense TaxID=414052 RepID=A0A286GWJ2_9PROT|nr:hypothetical protein [Caenispirillum bisanense]SOD99852.1 hypothetical protein SAMN05421508_11039 [Caenispirillum bisanense]